MSQLVLVIGATGQQGGAVAHALLSRGARVRALVRTPTSARALALQDAGAELVQGDLDRPESVVAAARGVDAAFLNTSPFSTSYDHEARQGVSVIEALAEAAVPHVVYSSIANADRDTGIGHFDSKLPAEAALKRSGLAYTITAPVYFADNLLAPWALPQLLGGTLRMGQPVDRPLQVVSLQDIGAFNAAVIARGPSLAGRRIDYAGDELSPRTMAGLLEHELGRTVGYEQQSDDELGRFGDDMVRMFHWFDAVGYSVDRQALAAEFPEVPWQSFGDWASAQPWTTLAAQEV